eukprot:COSAG02_NODE_1802_length_10890_cov_10.379205_6_plen_233_part_00
MYSARATRRTWIRAIRIRRRRSGRTTDSRLPKGASPPRVGHDLSRVSVRCISVATACLLLPHRRRRHIRQFQQAVDHRHHPHHHLRLQRTGKVRQPADHPRRLHRPVHPAELPCSSTINCRHRNEHLSLFQIWWCRMFCLLPPLRHSRLGLRFPAPALPAAQQECDNELQWRMAVPRRRPGAHVPFSGSLAQPNAAKAPPATLRRDSSPGRAMQCLPGPVQNPALVSVHTLQ